MEHRNKSAEKYSAPAMLLLAVKLGLLFLWQLPQQLAGMLVLLVLSAKKSIVSARGEGYLLTVETSSIGLSLGWFVFWTPRANRFRHLRNDCLMHEIGHSKQSLLLGPFYLLVVGIPSLARSAYSRYYYKKHRRSWKKYYDAFPENWADRLGGVVKN